MYQDRSDFAEEVEARICARHEARHEGFERGWRAALDQLTEMGLIKEDVDKWDDVEAALQQELKRL